MSIDWSKAPSWATQAGKNRWNELAWLGDKGYSYLIGNGGFVEFTVPRAFTLADFEVVSVRTTEWNGEGLPPVGTHVEIFDPEGVLIYGYGESGEVIAHVEDTAVVRMSYGLGCFTAKHLRTAEQIAAEDREKAVHGMLTHMRGPDRTPVDLAMSLYDAGYRKQSQP